MLNYCLEVIIWQVLLHIVHLMLQVLQQHLNVVELNFLIVHKHYFVVHYVFFVVELLLINVLINDEFLLDSQFEVLMMMMMNVLDSQVLHDDVYLIHV